MQSLKLTLLQSAPAWHDAGANRALVTRRIEALSAPGDVIVLPEMFTTGFTMAAAEQAEPMDGESVAWMRALARRRGAALCGSLVISEAGRYYNRFLWAAPDGTLGAYDKRHCFRMAGEHEQYTPGGQRVVMRGYGWRMCPQVCYDLRFPVFSRNRGDYDLLIYVANWPAVRLEQWHALLRARAVENLSYVVGVNRVGTDGNSVVYAGGSAAYDFAGRPLAEAGDGEAALNVTLEGAALQAYRADFPAHIDADSFTLDDDENFHDERGQ